MKPILLVSSSKGHRFVKYLTLHAANTQTDGDLEMRIEPTGGGNKMSTFHPLFLNPDHQHSTCLALALQTDRS
jgi:hypothetical protein